MKVKLNPLYRKAHQAGLHLLSRAQENAAKAEDAAGNKDNATQCRVLAAKVEAEQERMMVAGAEVEFTPVQRDWAARGLELYCRNARAGSGTMKGLMEDTFAATLVSQADEIESEYLTHFREQASLPLTNGKGDKVDGKSRGAGERDDEPIDEGEPQATFPSLREHAERSGDPAPAKAPKKRFHQHRKGKK